MKKVLLLKGLPGSGKTTYAKKLLKESPHQYKRINRDDLRNMFDDGLFSKGNERFVRKVRDLLIVQALKEGKHVIVDDTNLVHRNELSIRQLVSEFNRENEDQVQVEVVEMDATLEESIRRDALREKPVGEKVIRDMHRMSQRRNPEYVSQDEHLPKAILCDIDGTLALINGRSPYEESLCEQDLLHEPVARLVRQYHRIGYEVLLLSGRKDSSREQTLNWLTKYQIPFQHLWMRRHDDTRKDAVIKQELYEEHIQGKYFIEFVLDDRDQVVDLWRNTLKLPCFQVFYGNF
ncbi:MAG TPA: AAA family ATPase [Saprospiraceae bacterium]|nr:AAA family ATPase [Saprospiraceae bacterium]HMQ83658.1 AAA family ATPase [Saprospiraceae bacterium]